MKKADQGPHAPARPSHEHHGGHHHHFMGIDQWVARLDNPAREQKQRPREVIAGLNLQDGEVVADIGAGTGYFALRIAEAYPKVTVIAADAQQEMVDYLQKRAQAQSLTNLEAVVVHPTTPALPAKADLALLVDTLHHIADRPRYFSHLKENLAPGARIVVIDYRPEAGEGPPSQLRISEKEVAHDLEPLGYELGTSLGFLPNQYILTFKQR